MASTDPDQRRALYIISVAAELAGVHAQTLRIYERKGLIEPARTEGGSRRYSDRDIQLLQRIQELTNEGVGLAGVRRILDLEARLADAAAEIDRLKEELASVRREMEEARRARPTGGELVPVAKTVVRVRRS
ncbi:MAG TPA: MerR family transcriptional regulator [Acidimicrobiia bacterium]|nr:MerR family transcriptional regulator [Acidimicrobiia bacterium]